MKPNIITAFEAQDGSLFKSAQEAVDHDEQKRWEAFYKSIASESIDVSANDMMKIVALWELFKSRERLAPIVGQSIDALELIEVITPIEGETVRSARRAIAKATGGAA